MLSAWPFSHIAPIYGPQLPEHHIAAPSVLGGGSGPQNSFTPLEVRAAYGVDKLLASGVSGAGQTIAIIGGGDNTDVEGSLASFDTAYGIPPPPSFTKINGDGSSTLPATNSSWNEEENLDVEMSHAMAPGANIVLFEDGGLTANAFSQADWLTIAQAIQTAKNVPGVSVISMSFGDTEQPSYYPFPDPNNPNPTNNETGLSSDDLTAMTNALSDPTFKGITFVAAAGDTASPALFPATDPNVISVGETALSLNSGTYSEAGDGYWRAYPGNTNFVSLGETSATGQSVIFAKPSYQPSTVQGVASWSPDVTDTPIYSYGPYGLMAGNGRYTIGPVSVTGREVPDIGAVGGGSYGVTIAWNGNFIGVGGSSVSAPMIAGLIADANQVRTSNGLLPLSGPTQTLPTLYSLPSTDFTDIATGVSSIPSQVTVPGYSNVWEAKPIGVAAAGFDTLTGLGSPIANKLVPDLAASEYVPAMTTATIASPVSGYILKYGQGTLQLSGANPNLNRLTVSLGLVELGSPNAIANGADLFIG
jgi:subtilase family serine protease